MRRPKKRRDAHIEDAKKGILEVTGLRSKKEVTVETKMTALRGMTIREMDEKGLIPKGIPGMSP